MASFIHRPPCSRFERSFAPAESCSKNFLAMDCGGTMVCGDPMGCDSGFDDPMGDPVGLG